MHPSVKKEQKINMQLTDPHKEPCLLEQDNVPFVQIVMKCVCIYGISYMLCFFISVREKAVRRHGPKMYPMRQYVAALNE